ncbi:MAG: hypothetical protein HOG79_08870, partial [Prolixibacteraceae bacterium]|nr:hypothetical protein [Prolixibacteraceae bacterium]
MKLKPRFIPVLILFVLIFVSALTLFSQPLVVKIYPEIKRQKIESIGGNYCQANYTGKAWDAIGEATLKDFKPSHVRVALPLQFNELEYSKYKGGKLLEQNAVISLLETMKRMKDDYGVSNFTVSVWRVANELVDKPERRDKRRVLYEKYDEVIDMLLVFLIK